jgi:hypothetical protein
MEWAIGGQGGKPLSGTRCGGGQPKSEHSIALQISWVPPRPHPLFCGHSPPPKYQTVYVRILTLDPALS